MVQMQHRLRRILHGSTKHRGYTEYVLPRSLRRAMPIYPLLPMDGNVRTGFHCKVQLLRRYLKGRIETAGKREKAAFTRIAFSKVSWHDIHEAPFLDLKDTLKLAVKLAYRKGNDIVLIFTDASDKLWAGVVTQTAQSEADEPAVEQKHEQLALLGGTFSRTQENWSTSEK